MGMRTNGLLPASRAFGLQSSTGALLTDLTGRKPVRAKAWMKSWICVGSNALYPR
jgi:hypothetical protein